MSSTMRPVKVLVAGATGYIGGSVLDHLLHSTNTTTKSLELSVLVRNDSRVEHFRSQGLTVYTMTSLDDHDAIILAASQNDIVINAALGYHADSARSHITGLAQRKASTKRPVLYLHTSGASSLSDRPITKTFHEKRIFSDVDDDIYAYMQSREAIEAYPQRTADLVVVEAGKSQDVPTTILMPPTIYAPGTGPFNRSSIQIPTQIRGALKAGKAGYIGDGAGQWDYVHIEDLAALYELVVLDFVTGRNRVGRGERGIVFTGTGSFRWREIAVGVSAVGQELGVLNSRDKHDEPESWTLARAAETWFGGGGGDGSSDSSSGLALKMAELGFASNSRTKSDVAQSIGWVPTRTRRDWSDNFKTEFKIILDEEMKQKKRGDNL